MEQLSRGFSRFLSIYTKLINYFYLPTHENRKINKEMSQLHNYNYLVVPAFAGMTTEKLYNYR